MDYFYHSAAGPYGLDFLDKLFAGLDEHWADNGHAQIVTAAPGDQQAPTLLLDLIQQRLSGSTTVLLNPYLMTFDEIIDRLAEKEMGDNEAVEGLRRLARADGVTYLHLCVLHYEKEPQRIQVEPSKKIYAHYWDIPVPEYQFCLR